MPLIGLGHVKRSGKDTAAVALRDELGFRRDAFADDLKKLALELDPIVSYRRSCGPVHLSEIVKAYGWERAKDIVSEVRLFLQRLGVGVREVLGHDIWIRKVLDRVKLGERVVISDVRFVNEAEAIQAAGGKVLRIDRPGFVAEGHVSETALADWKGWDAVLANDGTPGDLRRLVVSMVQHPSLGVWS